MRGNCEHQWIANSGNNDKTCRYCWKYPLLKLRYRCSLCILESCRSCLIEKDQLPLESSSIPSDNRPNRYQTLEFRIIALENIINTLTEKLTRLEDMVEKINTIIKGLE